MSDADDPQGWTEEQLAAYYGTADDPIEEEDQFEWEGEAELLAIDDTGEASGEDGSVTA